MYGLSAVLIIYLVEPVLQMYTEHKYWSFMLAICGTGSTIETTVLNPHFYTPLVVWCLGVNQKNIYKEEI